MPSKSRSQYRFFKYLENSPEAREEKGISKEKVQEFTGMTKDRFKKLKERLGKKKS